MSPQDTTAYTPTSFESASLPPPAFASSDPLAEDQLVAAPIRYPRPSRLAAPLKLEGARADIVVNNTVRTFQSSNLLGRLDGGGAGG